MLFDHADAFSNRPAKPFPLDFSAGRVYHTINFIPYGPLWRKLRHNLTVDILHPTRLSLQEPLQWEAVTSLVAGVSAAAAAAVPDEAAVVVRGSLRAAAYALMARLCFGGGTSARDVDAIDRAQMEFLLASTSAKEIEQTKLPRIVYWRRWLRSDAAFYRIHDLIISIIAARRRRQPAEQGYGGGGGSVVTYVDSLLDLRVDDDGDEPAGGRRMLKEEEMALLVWEFIVTSAESVVSCVEWTLAHLVSHPEVQKKLHDEVVAAAGVELERRQGLSSVPDEHLRSSPYLRAVILECLRMHPTVPFLTRGVGAEHAVTVVVGGAAKRSRVLISARDIGRDATAWSDPDEFRPGRFLAGGEGQGVSLVPGPKQDIRMIPFGAGRRHCPGVDMAMAHIRCFLAALVREFEWVAPLT